MLINRLSGGLGNQLFQYAFGMYLEHLHQKKVWLDAMYLSENRHAVLLTQRDYSLHIFKICPRFCNQWHLALFQQSRYWRLNALATKIFDLTHYKIIEENDDPINPEEIYPPALLQGTWQDYRYVQAVETILRQHLQFRYSLKGAAKEWQQRIDKEPIAVALHVRRGDYLKPHISQLLPPLPVSYYKAAVSQVCEKFGEKAFFYIFSDDTQWCREQFARISLPHEVVPNQFADNQPFADFQLMTRCRHFIIANSTFSWWGAWLGTAPDKQVWAPAHWFADAELNQRKRTRLIPPEWHTVQ
ncbi:MAG: alpha-1,2-fucosyltransferase [Cytophagales bacterium]|nr:alpha-1,2-fucosyltransferase [Bernardetiaceae bacterium]MDW8205856.1 alpha-1,2-fucosyltransferase [Cytophagales bacterium]